MKEKLKQLRWSLGLWLTRDRPVPVMEVHHPPYILVEQQFEVSKKEIEAAPDNYAPLKLAMQTAIRKVGLEAFEVAGTIQRQERQGLNENEVVIRGRASLKVVK